jgi:hypothetical protein
VGRTRYVTNVTSISRFGLYQAGYPQKFALDVMPVMVVIPVMVVMPVMVTRVAPRRNEP